MPSDQFDIYNDTDDPLPAGGLCQWAGGVTSKGAVKVVKPTADSAPNLIVCGPHGIAPRSAGLGTFAPAVVVAFEPTGGAPGVGDALGSQVGSFLAKKGNTGFVCYGGASGPWALCARDSRGGGGITVEEVDGAPAVPRTTTLRFHQADGFAVSEVEPGVARVDLVPPTGGCAGCGWVAGLTELDCLLASVVERLGRCACATACVDADTGARYPSTATPNGDGCMWVNPDQCRLQDGDVASIDDCNFRSESITTTGYGFSIPTDATIKGIELTVRRLGGSSSRPVVDYNVQLRWASGTTPSKADTVNPWPTGVLTDKTYGGPTDLWGRDPGEWSPADLNNSAFGANFQVEMDPDGTGAEIDSFGITVYYCTLGDAPATNDGPVFLTSADGEEWTATGDGSTVTICGVEYALTFSKEGCDGPCLALTSGGGSGTAYTAVRDCCGPNYAIFSIGTTAVCSGTTDATAGPAGNIARIKVEWSCCPADGYDGPGYYCVRDAGTEDACAAVELTSGADSCDLEICDGPFETLEEAQAQCPDTSGNPIMVACEGEEDREIPRLIYLALSNVSGTHTEWEGLVVPLVYGPLPGAVSTGELGWYGCVTPEGGDCAFIADLYFECPDKLLLSVRVSSECGARAHGSALLYALGADSDTIIALPGYSVGYTCPSSGTDTVDITITKSAP